MTKVDIDALASLARLELSDEERAKLETEIPDILKFVETMQQADVSGIKEEHRLRNVMREDANPYESGKFTEVLLKAAPEREGDRIAVKQVISRKKK
jgi:aspartyl-tRNA(Asn)/glutamyl-tRNA(Gln) amidotransferase subunit C